MHYFKSALIILVILSYMLYGCAAKLIPKEVVLDTETRFAEVEEYLEKKFEDKCNAPTDKLFYLCRAYGKLKKYNKLFPCLNCLQERIDSGDTDVFFMDHSAAPLVLRATAYLELGQYENAILESEAAYKLVLKKKLHPIWEAEALSVYGLSNSLGGNKKQAEEILALLSNLDTGFYAGLPAKEIKKDGLAKLFFSLKRYEEALNIVFKFGGFDDFALAVADTIHGVNVYMDKTMPIEFIKYKSLFETGRWKEAKIGFDKLLGLTQIKDSGSIYWQILYNRGRIAIKEEQFDKGISFFAKAIEVIEQQRSTINTEASKIGFVGNKQEVYQSLIAALFHENRYIEAFEYTERAKARALVDMLASKKRFLAGERSQASQKTVFMEDLDRAEIKNLIQDYRISPQERANTRSIIVQIKNKILQTDPELSSLITVMPPDIKKIQELIPLDETLVEYFSSDDTLFTFIVNHDRIRGVKLEIEGLRQKIEAFRDHIMVPDSYKFKADGQALYEKIIQPIEGMIGSKNLTIVPHGALHYLPFNALCEKDGFLIDRYNIRVLPSASVMPFLKDHREDHDGHLLAFGNPDLGDPTYDLLGAQNEAIAITKGMLKTKLLLRKQATETSVKRFGDQFRYIHFATHGTFDAKKPLSSGLLMSSDSENDGTLTVGELYDLCLPADLVTLSACETALGKVSNGDDVVGFTRGFLYAGVSSIISSLWKIDDQATSILMQQFYKSLKETDKRSALRTAQLKVKNTYNPHPYFWAAFQITGSVQ